MDDMEARMKDFENEKLIHSVYQYFKTRGMPHYSYAYKEKIIEFHKIKNSDYENGIIDNQVLQKFHGIGLAWSYFPHHWEVQVGKMKRPIDIYNDEVLLKKAIASRIKWGGKVGENGFMTDANLRKAIRTASGVQAVSNFRPHAAASIYHKYANNGVVWDMSCGYGGRLFGALACGLKKYIGTEPAEKTFDGLNQIKKDFDFTNTQVELHKIGAEDFIPREEVDLCFTSPPYFDTEQYSNEESQSYLRYPTKNEWLNGFYKSMINNCYQALKNDGYLIINIANVKTYEELEEDTFNTTIKNGFKHITTHQLRLSSISKGGFKYEPVFVFKKEK